MQARKNEYVDSMKELVKLLTHMLNMRTNSLPCAMLASEKVILNGGLSSEESSLCFENNDNDFDDYCETVDNGIIFAGPMQHNLEKKTIDKWVYRFFVCRRANRHWWH
mmetsp:Transcript_55198/g.66456  ORF Transcript_55198/g.66456 Transcript_55198/m.66456 type:complete len:108 (+) Transcript_55198:116-439(+)